MIFQEMPVAEAEGVLIAHTLKLPDAAFKKGRRLSRDDVGTLVRAGIARISGARLQPDDLGEDAAAQAAAETLVGENTLARKPYTGRCNLHAAAAGVLLIDQDTIHKLNAIDESITVGTLPPYAVVRPGQVIATIKIIPFAAQRKVVETWRSLSAANRPLRVAKFIPHAAALILSELPGLKDKVLNQTIESTSRRLRDLGSNLEIVARCKHDEAALQDKIREVLALGCNLVLISGATVTKDRHDVVPSAIKAAGGHVEHFGMPVEPGNMLLLANVGAVPVINLPGCARSRRLNGLDWILHRLVAHLPVTRFDIVALGVGGLIRTPLQDESPEVEAADCEAPKNRFAPEAGVGDRVLEQQ